MPIEVAGAKFPDVKTPESMHFCCVCSYCFSVPLPAVKHTLPIFLVVIIPKSFQSLSTLPFLSGFGLYSS